MLNERQQEIVRLIERLERITVNELQQRFRTSAVTIRKDLDILQDKGILLRTHGGATLAEKVEQTIPIQERRDRFQKAKTAIAQTALKLIFNCHTVALDAGSTTLELARLLQDSSLRVVTNSLLIANALADRPSGTMVLLGGVWRQESSCFIGPVTLNNLERMHVDIAFVGASGFDETAHFTCQNSIEAQVKEAILSQAGRRFIVCDSSKYGKRAFTTFARFEDVEGLVVDEGLAPETHDRLTEAGLHVITAQTNLNEE